VSADAARVAEFNRQRTSTAVCVRSRREEWDDAAPLSKAKTQHPQYELRVLAAGGRCIVKDSWGPLTRVTA
jgi:hypothetical protein